MAFRDNATPFLFDALMHLLFSFHLFLISALKPITLISKTKKHTKSHYLSAHSGTVAAAGDHRSSWIASPP